MFRSKIFQRIFIISSLLIVLSIVSATFLFFFYFERQFQREVRDLLQNEILSVELYLQDQGNPIKNQREYLTKFSAATVNRMTVIDEKGIVFFDSDEDYRVMENHLNRPEIQEANFRIWGVSKRYSQTIKKDFLYVAKKSTIREHDYFIRVARPVESMNKDLNQILWTLMTIGICIILTASVLLYFSIRLPLKRIAAVIQAAKGLIQGQYHVRIPVLGSKDDEISLLSSTVNHLASNLEMQIRSLKDSEKKLLDILTHLKDGLVVIDKDNHIVLFNHAWAQILSVQDAKNGENVFQYIRNQKISGMIAKVRQSRKLESEVIEIHKSVQMESFFVQVFLVELLNEELTVLTMSNITYIKRADDLKRDFIANASHQLKTPLAAIQGYAETLMDVKNISEEKKNEYLSKIVQRSTTATDMIVKLLTLNKIEEQFKDAKEEEIHLKEFIENIIQNFEMELIKKDIRVVYQTQSPHVKIISYPHLLEITLVALIENAIHYSGPESQITIHLSSSDHWVKIQIQDQGMGMDEEEMEQIFERFYRAEKAQALYANGTGVGLALVDLCVKRLGGKIEVESQVEQGTVFSIQLPENIRKYFTDPTAEGS